MNANGGGFLLIAAGGVAYHPDWQPLRVPEVTVGGKVTTPDGRGLRNAVVSLTDSTGVSSFAITSSFGFYTFDSIRLGETCTISVSSKRYRLSPRVVRADGNLADVDFIGLQ